MTLKELIDALILLETQKRGTNGAMLVEARVSMPDGSGYLRREIKAIDSSDRIELHC
jgi:hypothetical protein